MDFIVFEHHLSSPQGHRRLPDDAFTATVDGGACCVRSRCRCVDRRRVTGARLRRPRCGAATAPASAA
jgi:hypothetical protein